MKGVPLRLGLVLAVVGLLTGCAEFQFLSQATKQVGAGPAAPPRDPAAPDLGARYKVGDPYQVNGIWYYPKVDYGYVEEGIASWYGPGFHGKLTANGGVFDEYKVLAAHRTLPMPSMVQVTNLENGRSIRVVVNDRGPFAHSRIIDLSRRAAQLLGFETKGTALVRVELLEAESRQLAAMVTGGPQLVVSDTPEAPLPAAAPTASVAGKDLAPPGGGAQVAAAPVDAPVVAQEEVPVEREPAAEVAEANGVTVVAVDPNREIYIQAGAFSQYDNANRARVRLSYLGPVVVQEYTRSATPLFRVRLGPLKDDELLERLLVSVINAGFKDAHIVIEKVN